MAPDLHTFDNGVILQSDHLLELQRQRYKQINIHEPEEESWIDQLLDEIASSDSADRPVFVDIGAAVGYYCFLVNKRCPTAEIHAFEPIEQNRIRLQQNALHNSARGIIVHAQAIARNSGTANLAGDDYRAHLDPRSPGISVPTTTIDDFQASVGRPLDLIKLDIQGAEAEALIGATRSLRSGLIKHLVIGTHSPALHERCLSGLTRLGMKIRFESQQVDNQPDGIVVASTTKD